MGADEAIRHVREKRPGSILTIEQEMAIHQFQIATQNHKPHNQK
jgi:protein-tyrosine phosphatase